jgi:2,4-dienoyl-CoA reductase-like NADH-dependent reductase (Old Yellow Enzyme family)
MNERRDESAVFRPLAIRDCVLPNRIAVPAMVTRLAGLDGHVNDDIVARYARFARGGAGLIVVEAMAVHQAKSGPLLRASSDAFMPGLERLSRACHDAGAGKVAVQIIHFLKIARSGYRQTVDTLSLAELDAIVEEYARAAKRVQNAGFDAVELHMAHAYTLSSFLSRLNPRRDAYGGNLENRLRLPLRVLGAVRASVGPDFPVGVRFVGEECIRNGYTSVDAERIAIRLAQGSADWISLSAGGKFEDARVVPGEVLYPYTGYSGDRCMPGAAYPDGANLYLARSVRGALRSAGLSTPVLGAGKVATLELAERALNDGTADLIGMARALLADPDIPHKWRAGREDRVVRCLYGNVCKALDENFRRVDCTLWPKGLGQAPESDDTSLPTWPEQGAKLTVATSEGRALLRWQAAHDDDAIYGYQIFRAEGAAPLAHCASVRASSLRYEDGRIMAGVRTRYAVRAYDLAGNRGPMSDEVEVTLQ